MNTGSWPSRPEPGRARNYLLAGAALTVLAGTALALAAAVRRRDSARDRPLPDLDPRIGPTPEEVKRRSQSNRAFREDHASWTY